MDTILIIVHVAVAIALVGLVLLQQGKGADMGAAFGSGASATVFGSQGSANFLSRTTAALATVFFLTSLILAYFSGKADQAESVVDRIGSSAPTQMMDSTVVPMDAPKLDDIPLVPEESPTSDTPSQ